jgi:predicted nuclease of predicted toxin-antitoxin system
MKLLLDQGLPRSAAAILRERGWDAVHVGDIALAAANDQVLLTKASEQNRVLITLDADFHTLLALSGDSGPSVIRIRIEGLRAEALADLIHNVVEQARSELADGAVVSVQERRIRVRKLPIWEDYPAPPT